MEHFAAFVIGIPFWCLGTSLVAYGIFVVYACPVGLGGARVLPILAAADVFSGSAIAALAEHLRAHVTAISSIQYYLKVGLIC